MFYSCSRFFVSGAASTVDLAAGIVRLQGHSVLFNDDIVFSRLSVQAVAPLGIGGTGPVTLAVLNASYVRVSYLFAGATGTAAGVAGPGGALLTSGFLTQYDVEPPVFAGCPASIVVATDTHASSAVVVWAVPNATDNVAVTVVLASAAPPLTLNITAAPLAVTYQAFDANGNLVRALHWSLNVISTVADPQGRCSFTVTVVDRESPVVTCPASVAVAALPQTASYPAALLALAPHATDNSGAVTVASNFTGTLFGLGTTLVRAVARDAAGNTDACTYTVTVRDTQPPRFLNCPMVSLFFARSFC